MADIEPAEEELVNEHVLVDQLNIPVKKLRALRPDTVVTRHADGVYWPLAAAQELARSLNLDFVSPKKMAADGEVVTVISSARGADGRHFPNPHIIQVRRQNGQAVLVRVIHSANYRPRLRIGNEPMTFRARPSTAGNWWEPIGRAPRYPGQW